MSTEEARAKVKTPAILLLIGGVINTLLTAGASFFYSYIFLAMPEDFMEEMEQSGRLDDLTDAGMSIESVLAGYGYGALAMGVLALILGVVVIFGAIRMMNLKSRGMAVSASVISLIPCFQACCLIGIPVGVYALMTLSDSDVKAAFHANS